MECSICSRELNDRRKPNCVSCAQATLYGPRIQQASALLDREKQHTHAEAIVRPGNDGVIACLPEDADLDDITAGVKKLGSQKACEEREVSEARINDITEKAQGLRQQIDSYKAYAASQKELHSKRRQVIAEERKDLEKRKPIVLEPVQSATRKTAQRLEKVRNRTVDARVLLCREAAMLSGLQEWRGEKNKSEYWLDGMPIPDLRELNGKLKVNMAASTKDDGDLSQPHELVTAAMDNVCRLLGNTCYYLSIRLPAEILLPHNDFPHALIVPEKAAYKVQDPPYPGLSSSQSASPAASRMLDRYGVPLARPRPLHLDRPLRDLAKDDTKTFSLFVEGVMLLAWDVAWLCRTQGLNTINSFEDICAIGRNLHQLLLNQEQVQRPPLQRGITAATTRTEQLQRPTFQRGVSAATARTDRLERTTAEPGVRLGSYSHGSAYHSLAGHGGLELLHGWRVPSSARLADKLKSYLLNEITGAEWDFLSDKEWDEDRADEMLVLVGGTRKPLDTATSVMTVAPHDGADDAQLEMGRQKGNSGWMKVRGRGGDAS